MLDTNILLSGLFFQGNERALLNLILHNEIQGVISETALRECRAVIERKFDQNPNKNQAMRLLAILERAIDSVSDRQAENKTNEAKTFIRDPDDAPILAAVFVAQPDYFVTGDDDFFHLLKPADIEIITCSELLAKLKTR